MPEQPLPINDIRFTSRRLVRELGFMGGDFAGTDLPPSAVHALIEIETCPGITARDLGKLLRLEKSSVSRMLRKLILSGDVLEAADSEDNRIKRLYLAGRGQDRVGAIHAFANRQVSNALSRLALADGRAILEGLRLYADALEDRSDAAVPTVEIVEGYRPGLIARITQMHALYYARTSGFGQPFESVVAEGLASFATGSKNHKTQYGPQCAGKRLSAPSPSTAKTWDRTSRIYAGSLLMTACAVAV